MIHRIFRNFALFFSVVVISSLVGSPVEASHYKILKDGSYAEFFISKFGPDKWVGRVDDISGAFLHSQENQAVNSYDIIIGFSGSGGEGAGETNEMVLENILDAEKFPKIRFAGNRYDGNYQGGRVKGVLDLRGVKQNVTVDLDLKKREKGADGKMYLTLTGETVIHLSRFGVEHDLGPAAEEMILRFSLKGVE